jgi:hypothetical protein
MKKIHAWEPWFFIVFGLFHLHRIWAVFDRESYALFWLGIMENKGIPYFFIMGVLSILCVIGIVTFLRDRKDNYWWRWIYVCGGCYLLFDLFAIATEMAFWQRLLLWMFDINSHYWNAVWFAFIILGTFVFMLGCNLSVKYGKQSRAAKNRRPDSAKKN